MYQQTCNNIFFVSTILHSTSFNTKERKAISMQLFMGQECTQPGCQADVATKCCTVKCWHLWVLKYET